MMAEKGSVLLIAVFLIFISSILIIGFLNSATTDLDISRNQKSGAFVVYIADSGIEAAIYNLLNAGSANISRTEFPDTLQNNTYYTVTQVSKVGLVYTLDSLGEYGAFQKTIRAKVKISGSKATVQYWKET